MWSKVKLYIITQLLHSEATHTLARLPAKWVRVSGLQRTAGVGQGMHKAVPHHTLTDAQPEPKQQLPPRSAPFSFIAFLTIS